MATERGYYRSELLRAIENIEMSLTHLSRVVGAYEKDHKDVSDMVLSIGNALVHLAELIKSVHDTI